MTDGVVGVALVPDLTVKLDAAAVVALSASLKVNVICDPAAFKAEDTYVGTDEAVLVIVCAANVAASKPPVS
jgi:hypothetical protein